MARVLDTPKRLQGFSPDLFRLHPEPVFVNPVQRLNGSESVLVLFTAIPESCRAVVRVTAPKYLLCCKMKPLVGEDFQGYSG